MRGRMPMKAVIAVGTGRYADPWHPFPQTADAIREVLTDDGWRVSLDDDVDAAMTRLAGVDLLVVVAGDPWRAAEGSAPVPADSVAGLAEALARGLGVLGVHSASATLRDHPVWAAALGGVWLPGVSMHPPHAQDAAVRVLPHALTSGLDDFTLSDELYSFQQRVGEASVLVDHDFGGVRHPLVWVREHGTARVAYDALGHDPRSFASASHREMIRRLARWAGQAVDATTSAPPAPQP